MKKVKKIGITFIFLVLVAGIVTAYFMGKNWTIRFKSEMDDFFGEGNWKCISEETKESIMFEKHIYTNSRYGQETYEVPGKYQDWYIQFTNRNGEEEIWRITNHVLKINHDKYSLFSSGRYSSKQAFVAELMDISFGAVSDEIKEEFINSELSEEEAECIGVEMSYHGGNPDPEFYDELFREDWFQVNEISAGNYLTCDLHDFYIYIRTYDYKFEKLTYTQQQHVLDSMERIENKLLEEYGNDASFELYFGEGYRVEYVDGKKQSD